MNLLDKIADYDGIDLVSNPVGSAKFSQGMSYLLIHYKDPSGNTQIWKEPLETKMEGNKVMAKNVTIPSGSGLDGEITLLEAVVPDLDQLGKKTVVLPLSPGRHIVGGGNTTFDFSGGLVNIE